MSKFSKKGKRGLASFSMSSTSDIVFMLIFFFMVSTTMRETDKLVMIELPEASETAKLERKDLASYINIGTPVKDKQSEYGTDARIQLNDSFRNVSDIRDFIAVEREAMKESDRPLMQTVIKADENVRMGIISDVKQELRRCSALKIMYTARTVDQVR